jgi:hypothetical protein
VTNLAARVANTSFAANVSFTWPKSFQVIQRNGSNQATITIQGLYFGPPVAGTVEARFNGGSWSTVAASMTAGAFNLTLTGQAAGAGTFEMRPAATPTDIASVNKVGIGAVLLFIGQSNMTEVATNKQVYTASGSLFGSVFNAVDSDPQAFLSQWQDSNNKCKSFYALFQNSMIASIGYPVGIICAAVGGTSIAKWLPSNPLGYTYPTQAFPNENDFGQGEILSQRAIDMVTASGSGGVELVCMQIGEQDTTDGTSQASFQADMQTVATAFNTAFGQNLMPAKIEQIYQNDLVTPYSLANINNAVGALWSGGTSITTGPDFSSLNADPEPAYPRRVHLMSDSNLIAQAAGWWAAVKAAKGYP